MPKAVPRIPRFPPRQIHLDGAPASDARLAAGGVSGTAGAGPADGAGGPRGTLLRPPPWEKGTESESGGSSFGTWLRRQREAREISLREIAERTKISMRYLQAMEEDRFEVLPAPIFAKGFLREYARYVGLSPDEVVNHYLSVQQPEADEQGEEGRRERRSGGGWPHWLIMAAAVLALLAVAALLAFLSDRWRQHRAGGTEPRPAIVAPQAAAVPPAPPVPAAAPSAPLEVTVEFNQECWVEAVVDGGSRRAEMREQGESMQFEAKQSVVFAKLGNAGAVEIQVNGYPYPLDRKRGEVVRDLRIDLDTVRALKAAKEGH